MINTQMSQTEINQLNYRVDGFNAKLKEEQKIVSKNSLEEADFMKLLITQLKTQDPTKPLDDKEFIGQMAQFTALKQMNELTANMKNLTKEFGFSKAVGLVNKNITWMDDAGRTSSGIVESIKVRDGDTILNIDGMEVAMAQIQEVSDQQALLKASRELTAASLQVPESQPNSTENKKDESSLKIEGQEDNTINELGEIGVTNQTVEMGKELPMEY